MKRKIIPVLVFLSVFFLPGQTNAQFLKKLKNQNDFVAYEVRDNELTLKTFGVTDNLTEGTLKGHKYNEKPSKPVWRDIAIKYQNNTFDVYYDGEHVFHKQDVKGNLIGLTISRSDFRSDDRYINIITIATNL